MSLVFSLDSLCTYGYWKEISPQFHLLTYSKWSRGKLCLLFMLLLYPMAYILLILHFSYFLLCFHIWSSFVLLFNSYTAYLSFIYNCRAMLHYIQINVNNHGGLRGSLVQILLVFHIWEELRRITLEPFISVITAAPGLWQLLSAGAVVCESRHWQSVINVHGSVPI